MEGENRDKDRSKEAENEEQYFFDDKNSLIVDSLIDSDKLTKHDFLHKVFNAAFKLIPEAEKGSYYELIEDKYIPIFSKGYDFEILKNLSFNRNEAFIDFDCSVVSSIKAYQIYIEKRDDSKFTEDTLNIFKKLGTYSNFTSLYAPMQVDGINVGIICLENFNNKNFAESSRKILKFYAQLISRFYSQKLHQEKESALQEKESRTYNEIVTALVSAIEIKDIYTVGHATRVREYSISLAKELNLSKNLINEIGTAAILHDVGKIGIPTEILIKPGKLSSVEFDIIRQHPFYSKKILEKISDFSRIVDFAYYHHEHYDGTGYPEGLKGNEIPFASQIIQIADAFDAITTKRSYRDAKSVDEALTIIEMESGKQFNPEIVQGALKVFKTLM